MRVYSVQVICVSQFSEKRLDNLRAWNSLLWYQVFVDSEGQSVDLSMRALLRDTMCSWQWVTMINTCLWQEVRYSEWQWVDMSRRAFQWVTMINTCLWQEVRYSEWQWVDMSRRAFCLELAICDISMRAMLRDTMCAWQWVTMTNTCSWQELRYSEWQCVDISRRAFRLKRAIYYPPVYLYVWWNTIRIASLKRKQNHHTLIFKMVLWYII